MSLPWNDQQPIYRQVRERLVAQILEGSLAEGEAVPSVRQWAVQGQINPITVSRAYQELVDEGVLEKRRGIGMFVAAGAPARLLAQERAHFLSHEWPRWRQRLERLGFVVPVDFPRLSPDVEQSK